jgi:putative membrane protein
MIMMHWDGYGWGMGFGWVFMILFWVLVVGGSVLLVRWIASYGEKKGRGPQSSETALDILKKRYARGEITRDDYERMKKEIS